MSSRYGLDLVAMRLQSRRSDASGAFPSESLDQLRRAGLLSAAATPPGETTPRSCATNLSEIAAELGESCLSTALIWSMHSQQVHVLSTHCASEAATQVCSSDRLVASVTSERGGASLFSVDQPFVRSTAAIELERHAPTVSYGAEAGAFMLLMKDPDSRAPRFVLGLPEDGSISVLGDWKAMGVRGTQTVPMLFRLSVPLDRLLLGDHRRLMLARYAPIGQLLWSASWLGAARGVVARVVAERHRSKALGRLLGSHVNVARLGRARSLLDAMGAFVAQCAQACSSLDPSAPEQVLSRECQKFNSLKVFVSENAAHVAGLMQQIEGMKGYVGGTEPDVEQTLRDLLSAPLMFNNDSLLQSLGLVTAQRLSREGQAAVMESQ